MPDFAQFRHDVDLAYQRDIVHPGKEAQFLILVSFLATFTIVRIVTHSIRDERFHLRNIVVTGGLHIHHLVPGILLLLLSGYAGIGLNFVPNWLLAVSFGVGAALTLDEFALWLHLEDVYWAKEGRDSVDAVVIAACFVGIGILGKPFFVDLGRAFGRLLGAGS